MSAQHAAERSLTLQVGDELELPVEASAATGYAATSGGFNNALSRLRTLELISGDRSALLVDTALGAAHR